MHQMNISSVDLNLLVVLDALLEERSVTRAAARVFLSQSATSHALDRLRRQFGDPLLERQGTRMVPTARAEELQEPLRELLAQAKGLLRTPATPLRDIRQTVHVAMADYPMILPRLWSRLRKLAPGIDLVVHTWAGQAREIERLRRGEVGVALSTLTEVPDDIEKEAVAESGYVGIMAKGHPLGRRPSAERFVAFPHVLVSATGARSSPFDRRLAEHGLQRRLGISVPSFLAVPAVVAASDAIALVPSSLAKHCPPARALAQFKPPIDPGRFGIDVAWHRRRAHDPAIQAVRRVLADTVRALA